MDCVSHRVLVIDNGSTDGSEREIRAARPDVELIQTGANLGFAGGNNIGIQRALAAGADYVWVLNPDTTVDPAALSELLACAEKHPGTGALTTRVSNEGSERDSNVVWDASTSGEPIHCAGCMHEGAYHVGMMINGPSIFLRRSAIETIELFDETYFHYYEDVDLIERIRRGGWEVGLACRAAIVHAGGSSLPYASPQSAYYLLRNELLYRKKLFGEHPLRVFARNPIRLRQLVSVRGALRLDFRYTKAYMLAVADGVRDKGGRRDLGGIAYQVAERPRR